MGFEDIASEASSAVTIGASGGTESDLSIFDLSNVGGVWIVIEGCLFPVDLDCFYSSVAEVNIRSLKGFSEKEMIARWIFVDQTPFPDDSSSICSQICTSG